MPGPSETLPVLEQRLTERLLDFDRLDAAWPRGRTVIERAEIGRQRKDALSRIAALRGRIVTAQILNHTEPSNLSLNTRFTPAAPVINSYHSSIETPEVRKVEELRPRRQVGSAC